MTKLELVPTNAKNFVVPTSRYSNSKVYYIGDLNVITFETYKRKTYKKTGKEKVMLITKGVEYRPDLVSYDYYGFCEAWDRILEANNMKDVFEFKSGKTIILPETL